FTGSTGVGRTLIETCGRLARPIQAELGGKNAVVVADDAPLTAAVDAVLTGAFSGNGQKCTATSRVVVMSQVRDEFCDRLASRVRELVVADPLDPATDVGPLVSQSDRDRIAAFLQDSATVAET